MTYECKCTKCGHEFEVERRITEPATERCPQCDSLARRLISKTTFVLQGSGWAADNYS